VFISFTGLAVPLHWKEPGKMRISQLGLVLVAMASEARNKAERISGRDNVALLNAVSFILQAGAERCIELAEESES
jgi:hypothetical protein